MRRDPLVRYDACHDNDCWVSLTEDELRLAVKVGRSMRRRSISQGDHEKETIGIGQVSQRRKIPPGEWLQILGAVGEAAVAKALCLPWHGTNGGYRRADLQGEIEVKVIGNERYGLRVYETIPDHYRVVGVVIPPGQERGPYRIPGWITAGDAKRPEWKMRPYDRGLYFYAVPQQELVSLREMPVG